MKLVIFDLDQTLVDFIDIHNRAVQELFRKYFHVDARLTDIDFAGRSLAENFLELARRNNIPEKEITQNGAALLASYETIFGKIMPRKASKYVLPGVKRLLDEISKTDNIIALYTGDSAGVVKPVFKATGLGKYFKLAVYGTEAETRDGMVRLAIKKAEELAGKQFRGKNVVIVGDSLRDVDCGKKVSALTIAVATGFHSKEDLRQRRPDYLFDNLKSYRRILDAIG